VAPAAATAASSFFGTAKGTFSAPTKLKKRLKQKRTAPKTLLI